MKTDTSIHHIFKYIRSSQACYLFLLWLIFSIMYWYAAWNKPFHVDEFYSWVYAQRCSFMEILMLKDRGIGHLPLYHLLQKAVQSVFNNYHFLLVRLVNYIAATFYILSLAVIVYRLCKSYLLCLGLCLSATVFEVFLFSRMYGLVSLFSLWTYCLVENFIETGNRRYAWLLIPVVIAGFFSDYNFVLMIPCIVISIIWRTPHSKRIIVASFIFLFALFIFTSSFRIAHSGVQSVWGAIRFTMSDIARELRETIYLVLNFSFKEMVAAGLIILLGAGLYAALKRQLFKGHLNPGRMVAAIFQWVQRHMRTEEYSARLILSLVGAYGVLLSINSMFSITRRDLIDKRFLFLLFPLIVIFLIRNLPIKFLKVMSYIWIFSGILFLLSNRMQNYYPPPALPGQENLVYQDAFSYSTQYLKNDLITNEDSVFLDLKTFHLFCRVCAMGRQFDPDNSSKEIIVVGDENFPEAGIMPERFILIDGYVYLSRLDELFFKYLTPIYLGRYGVFVYRHKDQ